MKLRDVAEAAGISESFLSQVERQKANISLTTLKSVANVFGLTIAEFFDDSHELPYLLREGDRPSLEFAGMGTKFLLTPRPLANLEVFIAHIPPGGATAEEAYVHGHSEEIVLVLQGELTAYVGDEEHVLREGDSLALHEQYPPPRSQRQHRGRSRALDYQPAQSLACRRRRTGKRKPLL